jgi:fatty-acid peroxygenase
VVHTLAFHRDINGELLHPQVVAAELLNILRPTVAVAVSLVFGAHTLHQHPDLRQKIENDTDDYTWLFVQEVRRFYSFFPMAAARVRRDFQWKGYQFHEGTQVLLDLYGTNHDSRTWNDPEQFLPERFREWDGNPYSFIPQGGGNPYLSHRCPGEEIAVELMKQAVRFLVETITYAVPEQNLQIDYGRLPAMPPDGFVITNVGINSKTLHSSVP